jgi:hypothetical protein
LTVTCPTCKSQKCRVEHYVVELNLNWIGNILKKLQNTREFIENTRDFLKIQGNFSKIQGNYQNTREFIKTRKSKYKGNGYFLAIFALFMEN